MATAWCKAYEIKGKTGTLLEVHAQPGASKTACRGLHGDRLKIAVSAPPVEGAANAALVEFLAKALGIPKSRVHLIRGDSARQKTFFAEGVAPEQVAKIAILG